MIVDDHAMFRAGVRAELGGAVEVVAEAADVDQAVAAIPRTSPTSCCSTCTCPAVAALEVMRRRRTGRDGTRFLALSACRTPPRT